MDPKTRISEPLNAGQLAQVACLLEATARKPGNVHRFRDFDETHYLDFILSASALSRPLDRASASSLGQTILDAVEATRRLVRTNTNLGMILLLVPLASVGLHEDIREGLTRVLGSTTIQDASLVYEAIRRAKPGGLGQVDHQDVADEPTITLLEAMTLAADRDLVARQYASNFAEVFDSILPSIRRSIDRKRNVETAIIAAYLEFLSKHPDTLIARKRGLETAREASSRAARVLELGWPDDPVGVAEIDDFDHWLRADGHARNPGATADLVTAGLFVALRDGTIALPIERVWSSPAG